jgi:radical S-adenosyl methionine domain-containing protein 2
MTLVDAKEVIRKLIKAGVQKITFAGGEPLLYKHIKEVVMYAKEKGATTSIITNGSLLTGPWLNSMQYYLDWVGVSVDSVWGGTNTAIGRQSNAPIDYYSLTDTINFLGYKLKINTVINAYNWHEDMSHFISHCKPSRWKVFQALRVEGQNDVAWDEIKCNDVQYQLFLNRHKAHPCLVPENNAAMTGSYLLIDPLGRLFENSAGKHTYSDTLINNSIDHCLSQIKLDREMFIERGGLYAW